MTFTYTLTPEEEEVVNELVATHNLSEQKEKITAEKFLKKILKAHLKIHTDKKEGGRAKRIAAKITKLSPADKIRLNEILGEVK